MKWFGSPKVATKFAPRFLLRIGPSGRFLIFLTFDKRVQTKASFTRPTIKCVFVTPFSQL